MLLVNKYSKKVLIIKLKSVGMTLAKVKEQDGIRTRWNSACLILFLYRLQLSIASSDCVLRIQAADVYMDTLVTYLFVFVRKVLYLSCIVLVTGIYGCL